MGTDFFDELGETLTRTARELGERAEQIYETQKIRNKISAEERIVDKLMEDMGNILYRRYKSEEAIDEELLTICEEIDQHLLKVKEYKANAADVRGKKICPSCDKAVDKEVSFCPYCGAACPSPEPDKTEEDMEAEDTCGEASEEEENPKPACEENSGTEMPECECDEQQEKTDCGSESPEEPTR